MKLVTFYLPFLPISIIFINKCAKITFFLFNALVIAFANFVSHNKPNQDPIFVSHNKPNQDPLGCFSQSFSLEYMSHELFLIFFTCVFNRGCYRTLGLGGTSSLVFNDTYNQQNHWNQNILPMEIYNLARCSIYNEQLVEKKKKDENHNNMTTITTWKPYQLLEIYNTTQCSVYIIHMHI